MARSFGRYQLEAMLGRGGTAEVWRATLAGPHGFRRTVVVKRLLPALADDARFVARLLDEARLSSLVRHANVAEVIEVVERAGEYALVLEHVDGCDLRALVRAMQPGAPPAGLGVYVLREVCRALAHAHALTDGNGRPLGIVHRDVSPANVMLARDGAVKLCDFGVARARLEISDEPTRTKSLAGNLAYMAPEQLAGADVDARADVYAAGVVLWEALTGKRLFPAVADLATLADARQQAIAAPSSINREVPQALDDLCARAMALEPAARPTASELAAALDGLVHALAFDAAELGQLVAGVAAPADDAPARRTQTDARLPDAAAPDGAATVAGKRTGRIDAPSHRRWPALLFVIAALALTATPIVWWWTTSRRSPNAIQTVAPAPAAMPMVVPVADDPPATAASATRAAAAPAPPRAPDAKKGGRAPNLVKGKLLDPFGR